MSAGDALPIAPGAEALLASVPAEPVPTVSAWLVEVLARHGLMAQGMVSGLDAVAEQRRIREAQAAAPALPRDELLAAARERAAQRKRRRVVEEDIVASVLDRAGFTIRSAAESAPPPRPAEPAPREAAGPADQGARQTRRTPALDRFGHDLTAAAAAGRLGAVIGRDREVDAIVETLCRRVKRNPLLVGPPGTGKTALVEAVAARVVSGSVPKPLKDARIIALQPSSIVAGGGVMGEIEQRMRAILEEASEPGIILFFDEVHTIVGSGGREGTGDIASLLKPALARDQLVCIAATTDDEYRRFISKDGALERRFQPIAIRELTAAETVQVLAGLRERARNEHAITIDDRTLRSIVGTVERALPNRHFPDKAIDLFDQLVAHAMVRGIAAPDEDTVATVASAMYGMPTGLADRIEVLGGLLEKTRIVPPEEREKILDRLAISLRGLDVRPERPNLTVLMTGPASQAIGRLAAVLSEGLFGEANRVVTVDCGAIQESEDVRLLVGAPAGYVGYDDRHALHAVAERPCSVVMLRALDRAHPRALEILMPALRDGVIVDLQGRRIHFSESVVLVGWEDVGDSRARVGFQAGDDDAADESTADLPLALMTCVDVVVRGPAGRKSGSMLLDAIADRWTEREGVVLEWHPGVVEWAIDAEARLDDPEALAAWGDREVNLPLGKRLVAGEPTVPGRYQVRRSQSGLKVSRVATTGESAAAAPADPDHPPSGSAA